MPLKYSREATRPEFYLSNLITITSETGVGSSTAIKGLRDIYGMSWRYISGGSIMRAFAAERGMTIEEFAAYNREHPEEGYDYRCDWAQADYGRQNCTAIESRLSHAFAIYGFHVLLKCDVITRAERRQRDERTVSVEDIAARIRKRDDDDNHRYNDLYPGCIWDIDDFDLVLSTAVLSPKQVVDRIVAAHQDWKKKSNIRYDISI